MSSPREVILEFMEGAGHDPVSEVKGLFYSISVVDIDVDIEHPLVGLQQLKNSQHAVVDVAES